MRTIDYRRSPVLRFSGPQSKWVYMEGSLTSAVQFHFTTHSPKKCTEQLDLLSFTVQTTGTLALANDLRFEESVL